MARDCPTDAELEAFSQGSLAPAVRERFATHVSGCGECSQRFLPLALRASGLHTTSFDSPRARARKAEDASATHTTDPELMLPDSDGVADTVVSSGEKGDPTRAPPLKKGSALDRYVVLDRLGAGGMGEVYAAWDPVLDRKVAVKLLRPDFHDSPIADELRLRLLREAQALARLSHPNVVAVHDVGLVDAQVYIAMAFADGVTLSSWLRSRPRSWRQVLAVFLEAGEGLAAAHAVGITHRDFKPDNVVVNADGSRARVMDFGLAHARADERPRTTPLETPAPPSLTSSSGAMRRAITQPGALLGTPAYMSPEALTGRPTDFRSDEFSFCVALYEGLYGARPFEGETPAALLAEIQLNRVRPPPPDTRVPRRIRALLLKGLRCSPDERFQTLRALLIQLGRRRSSVRRRLLASLAVVLVASSVGVSLGVARSERLRCAQVERRLDGVWDAPVRAAARKAFLATETPWAARTWAQSERLLDAWAAQWVGQRRAACEARASEADEALGQNLLCLSRRLAELEAVTRLFVKADGEVVERAVATASALPSVDSCAGGAALSRRRTPEREDVRTALAALRAHLDAGKYREAQQLARAAVEVATDAGDKAALAEAQLSTAILRARTGDPGGADALAEEAILLAGAAQDDELVARAWVERVGFAAVGGAAAPDDGDRWARHARAAVDRVGNLPELEASLANNLGVLAWSRQRYDEAVDAHQRALRLRTRLFGADHPLVARSHSNLGTVYKAQRRFDDAEREYRAAQAVEERALDPTHPAVAETLNNLGNVLQARRDFAAARAALDRALEIKVRAWGAESLSVAVTLTNLGALLLDQGNGPEAEATLLRALATKERLAGPESLTVALTLTNLAAAQRAQGRWAQALEADRRALGVRTQRLGAGHPDRAYNLTGLGQALLATRRPAAAVEPLEQALALRGTPSEERGETSLLLAKAYLATATKLPRARELAEQAERELPDTHPLRGDAVALLASLRRAPAAARPGPDRPGSAP